MHFREPGLTYKGDLHSESIAAAAGGVTSYMDMPNVKPPTVTNALLEEKLERAAETSVVNYSFYLGATNDNIEQIRRLDPKRVCGVKLFMGSSTGNMLVDDERALRALFAESPCPIAAHCEDEPDRTGRHGTLQNAVRRVGPDCGDASADPFGGSLPAKLRKGGFAGRTLRRKAPRASSEHGPRAEPGSTATSRSNKSASPAKSACITFGSAMPTMPEKVT